MSIPIKIQGGYVRALRGRDADAQEAALQKHGVRKIYRAPQFSLDEAISGRLRQAGDALAVSGGLRVLADTRLAILAETAKFRAKCFVIVDIDTGERSDCDGIAMLHRAIAGRNAEARMPDPEKAKLTGARGGIAKGKSYAARRMPKREALRIWRSGEITAHEALALMPGWSRETAYDKLGNRGTKPGRRKTKDE